MCVRVFARKISNANALKKKSATATTINRLKQSFKLNQCEHCKWQSVLKHTHPYTREHTLAYIHRNKHMQASTSFAVTLFERENSE